jgi:hypothetical protein
MDLPAEVREAANRGWVLFPVSPLEKLTGRSDLLIGQATSEVSRLKELAAEFPGCSWRVAVSPSSLCILHLNGPQGRASLATALCQNDWDCCTLEARSGDAAWVFFQRPKGLVLRSSARRLAGGVKILGDGDSCVIPPSADCTYVNPWAEIDAVPHWLRELAFEPVDNAPGNARAMPTPSQRPAPCRSVAPYPANTHKKARPIAGGVGRRSGFRISCRR